MTVNEQDNTYVEVPTIAVIMTIFNRMDLTIRCLDGLFSQIGAGEAYHIEVVIADDASTDGSASILAARYGQKIEIIDGPGGMYWSRGMACAQEVAEKRDPDFLLWVNNDVELEQDAVLRLLKESASRESQAVIVGAMLSSATGKTSYSGFRKLSNRPGHLRMMEPGPDPQMADSLNGNLVLVPRTAYRVLGTVDRRYSHAYGDLDYGIRARRSGIDVILAAGYFGKCDRNPVSGTWEDRTLSRRQRLALLFSRKGLPIGSHVLFLRKQSRLWPALVSYAYLKRCGRIIVGR